MKNFVRFMLLLSIIPLLGTGCKSQPTTKDIFAGAAGVFILKDDDTLWGAGYNRSDQFGLGDSGAGVATGNAVITRINDATGAALTGISSVAAGESHTVILKSDGTLLGAGDSTNGELGMAGGRVSVFTQLKAGDNAISGVTAITAGNNSTFYLDSSGSLWAAGYNYYGELGLGNGEPQTSFTKVDGTNIKAIAAGLRHTVLLKADGTISIAGYNYNGQLGLGDTVDRNTFTAVTDVGGGVTAIAAGNYHTVILKSDGSVWAAGSNYWGQLGLSDTSDQVKFIRVSDAKGPLTGIKEIAARGDITVLLKSDNSLLLAGNYTDTEGAVDSQDASTSTSAATSSTASSTTTSTTATATTSSATASVAAVDNSAPVPLGFVPLTADKKASAKFSGVKKIVLGNNSIYIIDTNGRLWAAGSNRYGQLNLGSDTETSSELKLIN